MTVENIAQLAHEINKAYCESIGDTSQVSWADAPEWQRKSAIAGVNFCLNNPSAPPSANHDSWLREKEADGWKYGPVKNVETKEHPCYVPYEQLPVEQKTKDFLFKQVVASCVKFMDGGIGISGTTRELTPGQVAVDVSFNVTSRKDISDIKQSFADAYDTLDKYVEEAVDRLRKQEAGDNPMGDRISSIRRCQAIARTDIEKASMAAVKAVTR